MSIKENNRWLKESAPGFYKNMLLNLLKRAKHTRRGYKPKPETIEEIELTVASILETTEYYYSLKPSKSYKPTYYEDYPN